MKSVVFYTRVGCHLCDDALAVVDAVRARLPFSLTFVDIDADADARAKYWDKIPVVEVDGRLHAKYRVDADAFERRLHAP